MTATTEGCLTAFEAWLIGARVEVVVCLEHGTEDVLGDPLYSASVPLWSIAKGNEWLFHFDFHT